jgi:uncharacterized protein Yka (UPF0111/DUF47 family)
MNFHLQEIESLQNSLRERQEYVTELENRLRDLWDKLEWERNYYTDRIKRLEEAGDEVVINYVTSMVAFEIWREAKEAKP